MASENLKELIESTIASAFQKQQTDTLQAAATVAESVTKKVIEQHEEKIKNQHPSRSSTVKSVGNRNQFKFCEDLECTIEKSIKLLESNKNPEAVESLQEGKKLIKKRMKLIKLADRENWDVVNEYLTDDMASDSEDEKRINKAIRSANSKREKRKKERFEKIRNRSVRPREQPSASSYNINNYRHNRTCWVCGRQGHFFNQCPYNKDYQKSQRDSFFNSKVFPKDLNSKE